MHNFATRLLLITYAFIIKYMIRYFKGPSYHQCGTGEFRNVASGS